MPIEHVTRTVTIDNLIIPVSAYRYICDHCFIREAFADSPMPEGHSEQDAHKKGWRISCIEEEQCFCQKCNEKRP